MVRLAHPAYRDGSLVDADQAKYLELGAAARSRPGRRAAASSANRRRSHRRRGRRADRERGFKLLLRAAEQGDGSAALSVARGYAYGVGVTQDATEAVEWYGAPRRRDASPPIGNSATPTPPASACR